MDTMITRFSNCINKKNDYLEEVAGVMKRLARDVELVRKELVNMPDGEINQEVKDLVGCSISVAMLHRAIFKYLKRVRFEPCWRFTGRNLIEDLGSEWDQAAWDAVISDCTAIEKHFGLL